MYETLLQVCVFVGTTDVVTAAETPSVELHAAKSPHSKSSVKTVSAGRRWVEREVLVARGLAQLALAPLARQGVAVELEGLEQTLQTGGLFDGVEALGHGRTGASGC